MRKLATLIFVTAVLAALGAAQGPRGGGFKPTPMMYLSRHDVRKELKVTDDQASKLDSAQQDMFSQMGEARQNAGDDPAAMQAAMKKLIDGYNTAIKAILSEDQTKRLTEVFYQMQGASVLTDPDIQKTLKLTDDQIKQVKDLQAKQTAANDSLREKAQNGEIDQSEIFPMFQKNAEALKVAIEKVLTDAQRAQLKAMGGEAFTPDPKEPQGFGFGRLGRPTGGGGN